MNSRSRRVAKVAEKLGVNASIRIILAERLLDSVANLKDEFCATQQKFQDSGWNDEAINLLNTILHEQSVILGLLKNPEDSGSRLLRDMAAKHTENVDLLSEAALRGTSEYLLLEMKDTFLNALRGYPECRKEVAEAIRKLDDDCSPIILNLVRRNFPGDNAA